MKNPIPNKTGTIVILSVLLIIGFNVLYYISRSPEFPESIPSSEKPNIDQENYNEQIVFFNKYTRYIRDHHGGIIEAEEVDKKKPESHQKENLHVTFRHRYKIFNRSAILQLTKQFSQNEKIEYRVILNTVKPTDDQKKIEIYEIEFHRKDNPWISVRHEIDKEYISRKDYRIPDTETNEPTVSDQDESFAEYNDNARLVIIIDDLGNNINIFNKFIQLDFDITYSILPLQVYSFEIAERVNLAGRESMLHQPMQPKEWPKYNPGLGALLIEDDVETIYQKLEINLRTVPYAVGVNNHMGSAYTQYAFGLNVFMEVLRNRNLFFLDSKTAPGDIAKKTSRDHQVVYLSRNIFLDNIQNNDYISSQLNKAVRIAKRSKQAIAIGHPYQKTYEVLARLLPLLSKQGVQIVKISELINYND